MADEGPAELDAPADAAFSDDSLVEDVRALADDLRTALEAEAAFQSARAGYVAGEARGIALWFALAALLAVIALCALAVGVLIGLTPLIGPWLATAAVVGALLIAALVVALAGRRGIRRVAAAAFPSREHAT